MLSPYAKTHQDGIGAHAGPIVKIAGKAHDQYVGWFGHIHGNVCPFIGEGPSGPFHGSELSRLHVKNLGFLTQNRIHRKELLAHPLFHRLADGPELTAHVRVWGCSQPIVAVHGGRAMMRSNRTPARKPGDHHLVTAAVAAVGIASAVADHNG